MYREPGPVDDLALSPSTPERPRGPVDVNVLVFGCSRRGRRGPGSVVMTGGVAGLVGCPRRPGVIYTCGAS